jgi:hypothetical protein
MAVRIQVPQRRQEFEQLFDGLIGILPEFTDGVMETYFIDQITKISSDFGKNLDKSLLQLGRLLDFARKLVADNVHSMADLPVPKPLKHMFAEFSTHADTSTDMNELGNPAASSTAKTTPIDMEFQDPHVYLREIDILDDSCLVGKDVSIKALSDKFMTIIKISLPLFDVAKTADKKMQVKHDNGEEPHFAADVESILNMLAGDQAKVHTLRIVKVTRLVHDLSSRIKDSEHELETLQARHDKPWMFMICNEDQMPEEKFNERVEWLTTEIAANNKKLHHVVSVFKTAPECSDLVDALEKLDKHVNFNIVRALNELILHIHEIGIRGLIMSRDEVAMAKKAGINLDSLLVTSDSPFPDLDEMNARYFSTKEQLYALVTAITNRLEKRAIEEKPIVESGIMAALLQIIKEHEVSLKGNAGCGFLCMTSLVQDAELDLLGKIIAEIDHLSLIVSSRNADAPQIAALVAEMGVPDLIDIDPAAIEARVEAKDLTIDLFDTATRLLKYSPLSREMYYTPAATEVRDKITGLAANLKVLDAIFMLLVDIGRKLEELDVYLPRKFIAMDDARQPTNFAATLDAWKEENIGRIFAAGGPAHQQEVAEKIEMVKANMENLEGLLMSLPDDIFEKVKPIPLPAKEEIAGCDTGEQNP